MILDDSLNADGDGATRFGEEIIVVDEDTGVVEIHRIEEMIVGETTSTVVKRIYENKSGNRPWFDATVARFVPGPINQVALSRASRTSGKSLWVLYYNPGSPEAFEDSYAELFIPAPRVVFAGDIDANGDDEIFMLRSLPTSETVAPHLIMRNYDNTNNPLPTL